MNIVNATAEDLIQYNDDFSSAKISIDIFDLEIMLLFPWSILVGHLPLLGFISGFIFSLLLVIGFVYEWISGVLDLVSKSDDALKNKDIKIYRFKKK